MISWHQLMAPPFSVPVGLALLISVFAPFVLKPVLTRLRVVDVPNERSSHAELALRGMGISIAVAIVVGLLSACGFELFGKDRPVLLICAVVALLSAGLGWIEDIRGLSVRWRALAQIALGLLGTASLTLTMHAAWMWLPFGAIAVAAYINVVNFMDGLDGISALHGVIVGLGFAFAGVVSPSNWFTLAGLVIAVAAAGFLPWNMGRGLIFMGDVGSYVLGGTIAIVSVAGFFSGIAVEYIFAPTLIYLADTAFTLVNRARAGKSVFASHREHVYQRLTDVGLSKLASTLTVSVFTVISVIFGALAAVDQIGLSVAATLAEIVLIVLYLRLPSLVHKYRRRSPAS